MEVVKELQAQREEQHSDMTDVVRRLDNMEKKVDLLVKHMERATGAWLFIKIMGTVAIGGTVLWNFAADLLAKIK